MGGWNVKDATLRLMRCLMTNDLATRFNFCGKGEKDAFGDLALNKLVFRKLLYSDI